MAEPKSGFTPYGTPESSLGITVTNSSSDGYPTADARMACPAVPALPTSREEKSDSSRQRRSPRSSSSNTSAIRDEARLRKLQAVRELAEAKYAMALAEIEYQEELEKVQNFSQRSRSSYGDNKLNQIVSRDEDRSLIDMQNDSLKRFQDDRAASSQLQKLTTVVEEVQLDGTDLTDEPAQLHAPPSGTALPSTSPEYLVHRTTGCSEPVPGMTDISYGMLQLPVLVRSY
jgi:hypothetical protein